MNESEVDFLLLVESYTHTHTHIQNGSDLLPQESYNYEHSIASSLTKYTFHPQNHWDCELRPSL
jgi:hypothetical protein